MTARQRRSLAVSGLITSVLLASAPAARAHHSNAAFDTTQTVSLEGAITRYEWANPHVYIWIAAPGADGQMVEWQVEGQPPAVLRRLGWSEETLEVGDVIQATGNPGRSQRQKGLLLVSLKRADTALYDGRSMMSALTTADAAPAAAAADGIAGVWVTLLDMAAMQAYLNPARRVPLTEAGAAAQAAFDETTMSPALRCIPPPAPMFMFAPDVKRVTVESGAVRIAGEFAAAERVIHLAVAQREGAAAARPSVPSVHGHSVGRWEGATLIVETTDFAPNGTGLGFTLPSSAKKRVVERITLDPDGRGLTYAYELTDPEMLTGPITGQSRWVYRPDLEFAPVPCDLANAKRFTE
jgi:hypothetical protein